MRGHPARLLCWTFCALFVGAWARADERPATADLLAGTVLEPRVDEIVRGEKVTVEDDETSKREMAVALACLIPQDRRGSLARFRNAESIMPVVEGTLLLYVNHTFVDRWGGPRFFTPAKRKVGRQLIHRVLKEMADEYGLCEGAA